MAVIYEYSQSYHNWLNISKYEWYCNHYILVFVNKAKCKNPLVYSAAYFVYYIKNPLKNLEPKSIPKQNSLAKLTPTF